MKDILKPVVGNLTGGLIWFLTFQTFFPATDTFRLVSGSISLMCAITSTVGLMRWIFIK